MEYCAFWVPPSPDRYLLYGVNWFDPAYLEVCFRVYRNNQPCRHAGCQVCEQLR